VTVHRRPDDGDVRARGRQRHPEDAAAVREREDVIDAADLADGQGLGDDVGEA